MALNLGTILADSARERPDHAAIVHGDRVLSYGDLDRAARGVAMSLRERGVGPGDTVAVMVPNVPEFTITYFGILYAGAIVVPLNVLLTAPEVAYHLEDSQARLLVAHPLFAAPAREGARTARVPVVWAGGEVGGEPDLAALAEAPPLRALAQTRED